MFCRLTNYRNLELYVSCNHFRLCICMIEILKKDELYSVCLKRYAILVIKKYSFTEK